MDLSIICIWFGFEFMMFVNFIFIDFGIVWFDVELNIKNLLKNVNSVFCVLWLVVFVKFCLKRRLLIFLVFGRLFKCGKYVRFV